MNMIPIQIPIDNVHISVCIGFVVYPDRINPVIYMIYRPIVKTPAKIKTTNTCLLTKYLLIIPSLFFSDTIKLNRTPINKTGTASDRPVINSFGNGLLNRITPSSIPNNHKTAIEPPYLNPFFIPFSGNNPWCFINTIAETENASKAQTAAVPSIHSTNMLKSEYSGIVQKALVIACRIKSNNTQHNIMVMIKAFFLIFITLLPIYFFKIYFTVSLIPSLIHVYFLILIITNHI